MVDTLWHFIFVRSDMSSVSPGVSLWWPGAVIDLLNRLPSDTLYWGNMADDACADFIGACLAMPEVRRHSVSVFNLPLRWERQNELEGNEGSPEYAERWRKWLFDEVEWLYSQHDGKRTFPVLVELGPPFHVTQGGTLLCQKRSRDEYEEGGPLWIEPG